MSIKTYKHGEMYFRHDIVEFEGKEFKCVTDYVKNFSPGDQFGSSNYDSELMKYFRPSDKFSSVKWEFVRTKNRLYITPREDDYAIYYFEKLMYTTKYRYEARLIVDAFNEGYVRGRNDGKQGVIKKIVKKIEQWVG